MTHTSPEGKMVSLGTVKGRFKAMERLVDTVAEIGDEIQKYRICIGHTDAPEIAAEIGKMMTERFGALDIEYVYVNPTAGSHCGPNGVGVAFHSKHR
jgi:fatty acid-binding protein DegV